MHRFTTKCSTTTIYFDRIGIGLREFNDINSVFNVELIENEYEFDGDPLLPPELQAAPAQTTTTLLPATPPPTQTSPERGEEVYGFEYAATEIGHNNGIIGYEYVIIVN